MNLQCVGHARRRPHPRQRPRLHRRPSAVGGRGGRDQPWPHRGRGHDRRGARAPRPSVARRRSRGAARPARLHRRPHAPHGCALRPVRAVPARRPHGGRVPGPRRRLPDRASGRVVRHRVVVEHRAARRGRADRGAAGPGGAGPPRRALRRGRSHRVGQQRDAQARRCLGIRPRRVGRPPGGRDRPGRARAAAAPRRRARRGPAPLPARRGGASRPHHRAGVGGPARRPPARGLRGAAGARRADRAHLRLAVGRGGPPARGAAGRARRRALSPHRAPRPRRLRQVLRRRRRRGTHRLPQRGLRRPARGTAASPCGPPNASPRPRRRPRGRASSCTTTPSGTPPSAAALDAIASARRMVDPPPARSLVTHLQLVDPADIRRMAQLDVVALPQPYWFAKDDMYREVQVPYLGQPRADLEYPMRSLWDARRQGRVGQRLPGRRLARPDPRHPARRPAHRRRRPETRTRTPSGRRSGSRSSR